jgi:glyoxylate reductase
VEGALSALKLLVASRFIDEVRQDIEATFQATFEDTREPAAFMAGHATEFDALLVSLDTPMPASQIDALPACVRALATYSVGTDHIDSEAAKRRGIAVFNTPGVLADSVAENALLLMLGAARRATESIELVRSRRWRGWTPTQLVGVQLSGRILGVLGLGDIGQRVAQRARALGMTILYCNRKPSPAAEALGARFLATPAALVAESDVLVLACPSTEETRGLVDEALLAVAKPGLIVVNIARGDLVDDAALVDALGDGRVRAAGLDVFAGEPHIDPAYYELPNVFMLPHIGSSTLEARRGMGRILIEALVSWERGGAPANRVC